MKQNTINFYGPANEWGEFSNFYHAPFRLRDKEWPTTEHYFQAQKFAGTKFEQIVQNAASPGAAALLGRRRDFPLRKDWEQVKDAVMYEALEAKFTQHSNLMELLVFTNDATLVEHTEKDSYWGDGGDGSGKNRLGELLMKLRGELRNQITIP